MRADKILKTLRRMENPANVAGMARFGIQTTDAVGIPMPALRAMGAKIGRDHGLALALWASGLHEARILAALVADPRKVTGSLMESWVLDFDSWGVCDSCCCILFDKVPMAWSKAVQWSRREETFVRRAGFVLMAGLAVHDKQAPDAAFHRFFPHIHRGAGDERNFVKKAVNWALRQIGKRNLALNAEAIRVAESLARRKESCARWVAHDALRELRSEAVKHRVTTRASIRRVR